MKTKIIIQDLIPKIIPEAIPEEKFPIIILGTYIDLVSGKLLTIDCKLHMISFFEETNFNKSTVIKLSTKDCTKDNTCIIKYIIKSIKTSNKF